MSTSDSDLSEASKTPAPPDHELEKALRREVDKAKRNGVDFSYKYIRSAAETELGLTNGFYKSHDDWNKRSKEIIEEQMHIQLETQSSPPKSKPEGGRKKPTKRKSAQKAPAPKKRRKTAKQDDVNDASEELSSPLSDIASEIDEEPKKKQRKAPEKSRATKVKLANARKAKASKSDDEEEAEEGKETNGAAAADSSNAEEEPKAAQDTADASESELSVLLDEEPPPKKRQQKDSSAPKSKKTTSQTSTKAKTDVDMDPDQAEIKRLQGWLVKCGVRKLWGKELKPYETSKAKIKHLKDMLADVGMTGRYSLEKANQIKEARELAADIEAVQEGAERWGAADDDEGGQGDKAAGAGARPGARRLVRGAKNYDFLSSDGEETD